MEKQEMKRVNQSIIKTTVADIVDKLRGKIPPNESFLSVISLSTVAYWYKDVDTQNELFNIIKKKVTDEVTAKFLADFLKDYWMEIETFSKSTEVDILKAIVLFFNPSDISRINGEFVVPLGISNLAIKLLDIHENDVVLNLCSGAAGFLIEAAMQSSAKQFIGVDVDTKMTILSNIRLAVLDIPIRTIQGNMLSQDFSNLQANKVYADFPFMVRDWKEIAKTNKKLYAYFVNAKRTVSGDWAFSTAAVLNQKKPGKTVVLMANGGLWNEADQEIRKIFITSGLIETVIAMPDRLLSNTYIPFTMLVFSQDNDSVKMVDASKFYTAGRRQNTIEKKDIQEILAACYNDSSKSKCVSIEELAEQEYILNPLRYIMPLVQEEKLKHSVPLGDICTSFNRGAVVGSSVLDKLVSSQPTEYQYLMLKDISDRRLNKELPYLVSMDQKYDKFCVQHGNLIISKISPFKVAMAEVDDNKKVLANGNLYFLDIDKKKMNPIYVMLYLQSEGGMMQLNTWAKGAAMKSISIKDLQKIRIPEISGQQQNKIAEEYRDLNDELLVISRQENIVRNKIEHLIEGVF